MLEFIRYATLLEGTAVHAARRARHGVPRPETDPDQIALSDSKRMASLEKAYWEIFRRFEAAGHRPLTDEDWQFVERLSNGERLWYRVGALMAAAIEADMGLAPFRELPRQGPDAFFGRYTRAE